LRLGGPVLSSFSDPDEWIELLKGSGYSAAYCPVDFEAGNDAKAAYRDAAEEAGILIAEVGAWSNPISPERAERRRAMEKCCKQLELAEQMGARCCVNIAGSRSTRRWDGAHPDNLSRDTFDAIVESVQSIIDSVNPSQTYYTLETMPWIHPDSADSYLELIDAVDRERFGVHLDPVNLINSPGRYFRNGDLIRDCFRKLGPLIRSCHGKDSLLLEEFMVHIVEVRPGLGNLDYAAYLEELDRLDPDIPLMLEHLPTEEEYAEARAHISSVARGIGVAIG
jgi:sugar phosphate isomerase/epimerase